MNQAELRGLAGAWRAEVGEALADRQRSAERSGRHRMNPEDQRRFVHEAISERLRRHARQRLAEGAPPLSDADESTLVRTVGDALFGLGALERLLADDAVEQINANGADEVWVTRSDGTKRPGPPIAGSDAELIDLLRAAAARLGLSERRFDAASPALSLQLRDGSRLFAVMALTRRPCVAIRRHRHLQVSLHQLTAVGTLDAALARFLAAAVRARKNMIVCGGTSAGKTTLLRALLNEVPASERLVTIEDSFELGLDRHPDLHPDVVAMETRDTNVEGEGEVTMAAMVRMALRMAPDRVIVGEVRGAEVLPMLGAMSIGNDGSMCTVHADSSAGAFARLAMYAVQAPERLPMEATSMLIASAVDFVVFIAQDGVCGGARRRWVASVREVVDADGRQVVSNEVFAPDPADRRAVPAAPLRAATLADLIAAGMDPAAAAGRSGWRP